MFGKGEQQTMSNPHAGSDQPVPYTVTEQASAYLDVLAQEEELDAAASEFRASVSLFTTGSTPNPDVVRETAEWLRGNTTTEPTVAHVARWSAAMGTKGRDHVTAAIVQTDDPDLLLTRLRWLSRRSVGTGRANILGAQALAEFAIGQSAALATVALDAGGANSVLGEIIGGALMMGATPNSVLLGLQVAVASTLDSGTLG